MTLRYLIQFLCLPSKVLSNKLFEQTAELPDGTEDPLKSEEQLQRQRNIKRPKLEKKASQLVMSLEGSTAGNVSLKMFNSLFSE